MADLEHLRDCPQLAYSVEKLENAPGAISCQPRSQSPIRRMNRRKVDENDLGGAQHEIACPPRPK